MSSDLVSLADAAGALGVSAERVRQLVIAGDLPGVRIGNAWAVPRPALVARGNSSRRRGRPLGPQRAWEAISALELDLEDVGRFRNRAILHRYEASRSDVDQLARRASVVVSGAAAAVEYGEPLGAVGANVVLYLPASVHDGLGLEVALVADPLGEFVVRVVEDSVWGLVSGPSRLAADGWHLAPRGAVALDLMESPDPRHWIAAQHLIDGHG